MNLPTTATIVAPAEYVLPAREIASEYMRIVERVIDWQVELMLPIALSPSGELPATHHACSMACDTDQVARMVGWIADKELWCASRELRLTEDLRNSFCVCQATLPEFLRATGLKVIH